MIHLRAISGDLAPECRLRHECGVRPEDLLGRLHKQAINVLALVGSLPDRLESRDARVQICRCAPSARDNYRSACRARSRKE